MIPAIPSGIRWTSAGTVVAQASGLLRLVLVSMAVSIQDLGYYAIAASLAASAGMFGDSGMRQLYLSRQADLIDADPGCLMSSVWIGGIGVQFLAMIAALPLGIAYMAIMAAGNSMVVPMAVAISGCGLVTALQNPNLLARERSGDFEPSIKSESLGQMVSLGAVFGMVHAWPSIWLLVVGQGIAALVSSIASYVLLGFPKKFTLRLRTLLGLLRLGKPFMWISATTYVTATLDKLLIGLMLSPSAAGAFFLAQRLADAPRQLHASVLGRTALPQYAKAISGDGWHGIDAAIRHYALITAGFFLFALGGLLVAHGLYAVGFLGQKWEAISMILVILLIGTACRAGCHVLAPALVVVGAVQVETRLKMMEAALYLVTLPAFIYLGGLVGAALAFFCIYAFSLYRRHMAVSLLAKGMIQNERP